MEDGSRIAKGDSYEGQHESPGGATCRELQQHGFAEGRDPDPGREALQQSQRHGSLKVKSQIRAGRLAANHNITFR
jgi:hypothetical protein